MLPVFDFVRDMTTLSIIVRLVTAMLCGGIIGIERELKRRPAGFRTHILICIGAAVTTLTSQYLFLVLNLYTDLARLGAQVICGIGFIGAGTIIVTRQQHIKGLTTAAGLWVNAIVGLCCGAGYIEGAVLVTMIIVLAEVVLIRLEKRFSSQAEANVYIEYAEAGDIHSIVETVKRHNGKMTGIEVTRIGAGSDPNHKYCAILSLVTRGKKGTDRVINAISALPAVLSLEEM